VTRDAGFVIRDSKRESSDYDRPKIFDYECEYDDEDDPKEWALVFLSKQQPAMRLP
jgi:hypothetical protein